MSAITSRGPDRARGRHGRKAQKPDPIVAGVRWVDERLGVAKGGRTFLDKIFPDHWSFLLGEIALYSFVVLVATGVFLSLYFIPSAKELIYHGPYAPLRGTKVSAAFGWRAHLSFGGRSGLVLRHMHPGA